MQLTSLIAAGLAVASTNALLLPPDVSVADEDTFSILPHPTADDLNALMGIGKEANLKLDCPGCPVRQHHRGGKVTTHNRIRSHLELDFNIAEVDGHDALLLNGLPLFPVPASNQDLTARLVPDFKKKNHALVQHKEPEVLGFGMLTRPVHADPESKMDLFAVDLQIIEVGGVFVQGIQGVEVVLIKTEDDKLMLVEVNQMAPQSPITTHPDSTAEECSSLLCQVKSMFKGIFSDFGNIKPCSKNRPPAMTGEIVGDADEAFRMPSGRPEHHGNHGHHRHGHGHHGHHGPKHHSWGHLFSTIATDVLLPVAFGVFAGVSASVIGMMVGTLIVHVWRVCVRGGGRCPRRNGAADKTSSKEVAVEEEKVGLMSEEEIQVEAPPAYENKTTETQ